MYTLLCVYNNIYVCIYIYIYIYILRKGAAGGNPSPPAKGGTGQRARRSTMQLVHTVQQEERDHA